MSIEAVQQSFRDYYARLPANLSEQVSTSLIGSFFLGALSSGKLTPTLLNAATGAMMALIASAVDPILGDQILPQDRNQATPKQRQQFWIAKCVITLAATALIAPALASLLGIKLKVNIVWTAVMCILPLVRDAWTHGIEQVNYNRNPLFFAISHVVPKMVRFRTF